MAAKGGRSRACHGLAAMGVSGAMEEALWSPHRMGVVAAVNVTTTLGEGRSGTASEWA